MVSINKLGSLSVFAALGLSVAGAGALDLKGSDTLEHITKDVITACSLGASLTYIGGGSSGGENAIKGGTQQVAPMSRFLGSSVCTTAPANGAPSTSEGYAPVLDGIALVQSRREGAPGECDTNADGICAEACPGGVDPALYGCKARQNLDQECVGLAYTNGRVADGANACDVDVDCQVGGTRPDRFCSTLVPPAQRPDPLRGVCAKKRFFNVKEKNSVSALQCPGCNAALDTDAGFEYELVDTFDPLKILWGGKHHDGTLDCNSDVRRTLADEWASLTRASCATQRCAKIHHVWRRSDLSGTTDTFLSLIGLGAITTNPFCNYATNHTASGMAANPTGLNGDFEDRDPIRRPCLAGEQVCQADGTLGLVLPVQVPNGAGLTGGVIYRQTTCQAGNWALAVAPTGATTCPDGTAVAGGQCQAPRASNNTFGCINDSTNKLATEDGRAHNLVVRNANGSIVSFSETILVSGVPTAVTREQKAGYYKIHTTTANTVAGDWEACRRDTQTDQIGCLTQASPCTIGFAGLSAINVSGVTNLKVGNVRPTAENIRKLITDPTSFSLYPLARKLYINTVKGFENVTGAEATLVSCFRNRATIDAAATTNGFVTLDDTATLPVPCQDFNETTCPGAPVNVDACVGNP